MNQPQLKSPALLRWDRVEHLLAAALAHDRRGITLADVRADFLAGGRIDEMIGVLLPRAEIIARQLGRRDNAV